MHFYAYLSVAIVDVLLLYCNCNADRPSLQKSSPDLTFVMTLIWIKENTVDSFMHLFFEHLKNAPMSVLLFLDCFLYPVGHLSLFFSFAQLHYSKMPAIPFLRIENTFYFDQANHILSHKCDQQTISFSGTTLRCRGLFSLYCLLSWQLCHLSYKEEH